MLDYLLLLISTFCLMTLIFIFGMSFKRFVEAKTGISRKVWNVPLIAVIVIGLIVDVTLNWLMFPILLDPPRGVLETVTMRMTRYKKEETGFKLRLANWLCDLTNRHDEGHC